MHHPPPDPTRPPLLLAVPDTLAAGPVGPGETFGHPGASAAAYYRRRRAAEWTLYRRTLPLRLAGIALASLVAALAVDQVASALAGWAGLVAAGLVGWRLWFRVSQDARNWQRGARGERRTARQLNRLTRHSWVIFHDLAVPSSGANADCDDSGAAVAVRSDPNVDRPGCLESGSVDRVVAAAGRRPAGRT